MARIGGCKALYGLLLIDGCMGRLDSEGGCVVPYGCLTGPLDETVILIIF